MNRLHAVQLNWETGGAWQSCLLSFHRTEAGAHNRKDMLRQLIKASNLRNYEVYVVPVDTEE